MIKNINAVKWFLKEGETGKRVPTPLTWVLVGLLVFASYFMSQRPAKASKAATVPIIKDKDLFDSSRESLESQGKGFSIDYGSVIQPESSTGAENGRSSRRVQSGRQSKIIVYDSTKDYKSEMLVPLGSMVRCLLIHNIVTNNFNAPVIAQVWEDFYFNGEVLLPFGTRIYGTAFSGRQRDRITVKFHSIVFPDGTTIKIDAIGLSKDGSGGLTGTIINSGNKKMFVEMAVNFLSGLALGLQDTATNAVTGLTQIETNSRNAVLNGVANTFEKEAQRIQKEIDEAKGYAVVLAGSELLVYFENQADVDPL